MKASISRCIISLSSSSRCHHSSGNFFENNANDYGSLRDYWDEKIFCADRATEEAENRCEEYRNEHPEDFDDYGYEEDNGDVESLSVEEAAQIWASQAKMKITCLGIQKMN